MSDWLHNLPIILLHALVDPSLGDQGFPFAPRMSALGQKRTCAPQKRMSALPPIADMCGAKRDVR